MRVYLGFTVAGNRSSVQAAKRLLSIHQAMGHQVLTSHLVQGDAWGADRRVPPQEIFARDMKWLAECDIFIAEVSGSSFGLGFETGYLLGATQKSCGAKDLTFDHGEYASKLHLGAVFPA